MTYGLFKLCDWVPGAGEMAQLLNMLTAFAEDSVPDISGSSQLPIIPVPENLMPCGL